jgi:histidine triad (HIT) family protein
MNTSSCLFCKIVSGEIASRKIYEDDHIFAFHDIAPQAPVHFLLVPKTHLASLYETHAQAQATLGHLLAKAGELAQMQGLNDGFRLIINTGRVGGQEVYHLHLHILGSETPLGPMLSTRARAVST